MKKFVISAVIAAALAGSAYTVTAMAANDAPDAQQTEMHRGDRGFLLDARLAGMKAGLKLTADQEKLWTPFESAVRDAAKARMEARHDWKKEKEGEQDQVSPIDRMTQMSDRLGKASEQLKMVAAAAKPLYDSLDDGQKRHFGPLVHMLRGEGRHGGWRHERG